MRKPESLRDLLVAAVDCLRANPEKLTVFIDGGKAQGGGGRDLSFRYAYTLSVFVEAYAGDLDMLFVPVLAWIAENQPELLGSPAAEPFAFDAEILDTETMDITIRIEVTEGVRVVAREGGGYGVSAIGETPLHDFDRFAGVPCGTKLWQLFLREELLAETTDPAFRP